MKAQIEFPDFSRLLSLVPPSSHLEFQRAIEQELLLCVRYAEEAKEAKITFSPIRETPEQLTLEFEVFDLEKPRKNEFNWHGQNTSQWVYAGAIVCNRETGRISRHH